jgi:hypothetical protein
VGEKMQDLSGKTNTTCDWAIVGGGGGLLSNVNFCQPRDIESEGK